MARTRTLTNLIADVRLRADNQALTDAEITEFINQSIADLRDQLASKFGDEYFETETPLTTTASVATVPLPADFLYETGLFWLNGSDKFRIVKATNVDAEEFITGAGWTSFYDVRYRLQAANIKFYPTPLGVHTVTLKYIPTSVRLTMGSDTFDGYNGWEEWVILDAASKCLEREGNDEDAALLAPRKQRMEQRIADMADRDHASPAAIQDTRGAQSSWPGRGWGWP